VNVTSKLLRYHCLAHTVNFWESFAWRLRQPRYLQEELRRIPTSVMIPPHIVTRRLVTHRPWQQPVEVLAATNPRQRQGLAELVQWRRGSPPTTPPQGVLHCKRTHCLKGLECIFTCRRASMLHTRCPCRALCATISTYVTDGT
jgi:hypothetical protein